jgi:CysZ protein
MGPANRAAQYSHRDTHHKASSRHRPKAGAIFLHMFNALAKGFSQLGDPRTRRVVWIGIFTTAVFFGLLWLAITYFLATTALFDDASLSWADWIIKFLGSAATLWVAWLFFPVTITLVVGLLLEGVAEAVEVRHYPHLKPATAARELQSFLITLRFAVLLIFLNLLMLIFLFFPPLFPFVFYPVNGYLLGREYFELVARRRLSPIKARALRKLHGRQVLITGILVAFMMTLPLINLLTPIVATATMVHLFELWRHQNISLG